MQTPPVDAARSRRTAGCVSRRHQTTMAYPAPHTGTTIVACVYKDGVVIGADTRVSTGQYISNRASDKITELCENVYLLRSGSAADTQAVADYVRHFLAQLESELGKPPSVETVAQLVAMMNYNNKQLVGAMIVGGYDEKRGGQVYGVPIGGTLVPEKWTIDGSGSTYIWGFCDEAYREGMSREEAEKYVTEAVALAISSDSSSGGCVRLVTLNKDGAFRRFIPGSDVPLYFDELRAPGAPGASSMGVVI